MNVLIAMAMYGRGSHSLIVKSALYQSDAPLLNPDEQMSVRLLSRP
jgi:hypothetical protein